MQAKRKSDTSDSSDTSERPRVPSEVSECLSFYENAGIDVTKRTAISATPRTFKTLEKFVPPSQSKIRPTTRSLDDKSAAEIRKQESSFMYEQMVPVPPTKKSINDEINEIKQQGSSLMYEPIIPAPAKGRSVTDDDVKKRSDEATTAPNGSSNPDLLKVHPNGRYEDEANDFFQQSPPPLQRRPRAPCHTDTTSESISESLSDGEVKCKCNASIGEIHICKYARNIKGRVQYLKRHPGQLLRYELAEPDLEVVGQKRHYTNWVSYYVKRPEAF